MGDDYQADFTNRPAEAAYRLGYIIGAAAEAGIYNRYLLLQNQEDVGAPDRYLVHTRYYLHTLQNSGDKWRGQSDFSKRH
jgi:hypothetical protein